MTPGPDDWHGWSRHVQGEPPAETLHVGPLPGRKSVCLYSTAGSVLNVHAFFRSEDEARAAAALLDRLIFGATP